MFIKGVHKAIKELLEPFYKKRELTRKKSEEQANNKDMELK
ncbi:MAG: hypothetical protein ACFFFT_10115 [Candidatus Thorarchaeota archaeon]